MTTEHLPQGPNLTRRSALYAPLLALGGGVMLAACGPSNGSGTATSDSATSVAGGGKSVDLMTWALFADPVSLDYAFAYDFNTNPVVLTMVESLLRMTPQGELEPYLAQSWKAESPTKYVYTLRQDVIFHDGTTMTAADAEASMQRVVDPKTGSYLASFTGNVKSVKATGDFELTVELNKPDALWQYAPATTVGSVVPKAFLEQHANDIGKATVGIVGTGPYKFESWEQGQQCTVVKNDGYWNSDRTPKVGKIVFKTLADENTVIQGMVGGQIDGAFNLSGKNLKALNNVDSVQVVSGPSYFVHYLGLNVTRPPFDDVRVRQALSYAIDKQGVLDATWGGAGALGKSPSTEAMWSFETDAFKAAYDKLADFSLDLDKAKQLINDAGASGASATILVGTPHQKDEGVIIQAAAASIGLKIKLEQITYEQLLSKIADTSHDYDGFVLEWSSDYPDPGGTLFQCFYSANPTDYTDYKVPAVDSALEASATETDAAKRAQNLISAQAQIVEDQSWVILFSPTTNVPLSSRLGGYQIRPLWYWDCGWAADISGV
ncbi:MAG: ABC transporter substrate-binding protein [Nostocoides sp.]